VVAAVRQGRDRDPERHERILDRIEAAAHAFRTELERGEEDPARVRELIAGCESCLEELGVVPRGPRTGAPDRCGGEPPSGRRIARRPWRQSLWFMILT
jgi:hypothetical protein